MRSWWFAGRGFGQRDDRAQRRSGTYDCPNFKSDCPHSSLLGGSKGHARRLRRGDAVDFRRFRSSSADWMLEFLILAICRLRLGRRRRIRLR